MNNSAAMRSCKIIALCLALALAAGMVILAFSFTSPIRVRLVSVQRVSGLEATNQERLLVTLLVTNLSRGPVGLRNMHVDVSQKKGWQRADDLVRPDGSDLPWVGLGE